MIEYIRGELTELTPAMAGMAGFEPAKCQSQSLVPYHLATSQCGSPECWVREGNGVSEGTRTLGLQSHNLTR